MTQPDEQCGTCRFWRRITENEDPGYENQGIEGSLEGGTGLCRRFPPAVVRNSASPEGSEDASFAVERAEHPARYEEQWCGEYQPRVRLVIANQPEAA